MENKPSYYSILTAEVRYDNELTDKAKLLYSEITALANIEGYCWATNAYFANLYKCHEITISKTISSLEKKGYIRVEHTKNSFKTLRKIYINANVEVSENAKVEIDENAKTPLSENANLPLSKNANHNITRFNNTRINTLTKNIKPLSIPNEFETLWALYPNKKGKDKAFKSYERARKNKDSMYEIVKNGIEMYKKYINFHGLDKTKIKHGSTWFNQKGWEDEYQQDDFSHSQKYSKFTQLMLNEMERPDEFLADIGVESYEPRRDRKIISHD